MREIRELNVGAYAVDADVIFPRAPAALSIARRRRIPAHRLRSRADPLRPARGELPASTIRTKCRASTPPRICARRRVHPAEAPVPAAPPGGAEPGRPSAPAGWRAIIGEGFTMHNVRRLSQALANEITRGAQEKRGVIIGYDRRFLSRQAAEAAAEVFAGNNIATTAAADEDAPTPLITYATALAGSAYGLALHRQPQSAGVERTQSFSRRRIPAARPRNAAIEVETNALTNADRHQAGAGYRARRRHRGARDFTNEYVDAVEKLIDLDAIRNAALKVIVDPMYGVGQLTLGTVLTEARCRVTFIHERHNPLFGGRSPAPNPEALRLLSSTMREAATTSASPWMATPTASPLSTSTANTSRSTICCCCSIGICTKCAASAAAWCAICSTTHLLDRLAHRLGEEVLRDAGGFQAHRVQHAGAQRAAGRRIVGRADHSRAHSGQGRHLRGGAGCGDAGENRQEDLAIAGDSLRPDRPAVRPGGELSGHARNAGRRSAPHEGDARHAHRALAGCLRISQMDGTKFYLENDNWALLRFSGTEPVLRLAVEADSPEKAAELIAWLRQFVTA